MLRPTILVVVAATFGQCLGVIGLAVFGWPHFPQDCVVALLKRADLLLEVEKRNEGMEILNRSLVVWKTNCLVI